MFDFAWSEIALTGLVAVLVLGPKELPNAMRAFGRFTRQARKLAGEFQGHVNDLVREAELEEIRSSVQKVTSTNLNTEINKFIDPGGEFASELARTEAEMKAALDTMPALPAAETPVNAAEAATTEPTPPASFPVPAETEPVAPPAEPAPPAEHRPSAEGTP